MSLKRFNDFMLNEAKKSETIKLEKEATAHVKTLIAKKPMTRYDIVKAIQDKFDDKKLAQNVANIFVSDKDIKTSKKGKDVLYSYTEEKSDKKSDDKKSDDKKSDDKKSDDKKSDDSNVLKFGSPEWREKYSKKGKKSKKKENKKEVKESNTGTMMSYNATLEAGAVPITGKKSKKKEDKKEDKKSKKEDKKDKKETVKESRLSKFATFEALVPAGDGKKAAEKDMNNVKGSKRNLKFGKDSTTQLKTKLKNDKFKEYHFDIQDELDKRKEKSNKKDK